MKNSFSYRGAVLLNMSLLPCDMTETKSLSHIMQTISSSLISNISIYGIFMKKPALVSLIGQLHDDDI